MTLITKLLYESSYMASVNYEIERYIKCKAHTFLDYDNDCLTVRIIDPRRDTWTFKEYDLSNKMVQGITSEQMAHHFINAYKKKILHEFFKND